MKVDIQDVSSCKKTLKFEIPAEDVKAEFEKAYNEIRQNIEVPGFRKGRAPRSILKLRFGEYIKDEVFKSLVPNSIEKAIMDNNLKVIGAPDIHPSSNEILFSIPSEFKEDLDNDKISVELQQEFRNNKSPLSDSVTLSIEEKGKVWTVADDKNSYRIVADEEKLNVYANQLDIDENKPLIFEVDFDVRPKIELPDFSELEVEKGDVNVTKDEVYKFLEELRKQKATLIPRDDRPLQDGDLGIFDVKITQNGSILRDTEKLEFEINKERVFPEFYDNVLGMNIGSEKEFDVSIPDSYYNKKLAGKEVKFHVILKEIVEMQLPELDDEFAKDLDEEDLNHLITAKWNQLVEEKRLTQKEKQKEEISTQLLQKINFEIPERIIDAFAKDISEKMLAEVEKNSNSEEVDKENIKNLTFKKTAEEYIRKRWIFEEIAESENISVSDEEIESVVRSIALSKNKDPQKYLLQLKAVDRLNDIKEKILEDKIYEFLIEKASEKRGLIV